MSAPQSLHAPPFRRQFDSSKLLWRAFALSLLLHLICYGGYRVGKRYHVWEHLRLPAVLRHMFLVAKPPSKSSPQRSEPPLMFVDVNPAVATSEAPKDARYYSDKNSRAANPDSDVDTETPKIEGKQTHVAKAEDVDRSKLFPLQPSVAAPEQEQDPKRDPTSADSKPPGDLVMAKPQPTDRQSEHPPEQRSKPRTLKEAMARQQQRGIPGEKMKQDGGVKRRALIPSFDAKATPFGAYDAALVDAVTRRWYDLLDNQNLTRERSGRVVLEFHLTYSGRITDMKVVENGVDDLLCLLCQKAVLDNAPYATWPSDMRREIGVDYRELRFTFYYN